MEDRQRYVAGFLFNGNRDKVALIQKRRPAWQAGKLNGIGGKIEPKESGQAAMRREFKEEAGFDYVPWQLFCTLDGLWGEVNFYRGFVGDLYQTVQTKTDERVVIVSVYDLWVYNVIPNVRWLIPMALSLDDDAADAFHTTEVRYK